MLPQSHFTFNDIKSTHFSNASRDSNVFIIGCIPEMSGLSNFAIQIHSWFFKTQSKSNHNPKYFSNVKFKSTWSPKYLKNAAFSQQKFCISFPLTQSKSGPVPKFWRDLQSGPNPNLTKFAIVRIQSNPSPVQCSSMLHTSISRSRIGQVPRPTSAQVL